MGNRYAKSTRQTLRCELNKHKAVLNINHNDSNNASELANNG